MCSTSSRVVMIFSPCGPILRRADFHAPCPRASARGHAQCRLSKRSITAAPAKEVMFFHFRTPSVYARKCAKATLRRLRSHRAMTVPAPCPPSAPDLFGAEENAAKNFHPSRPALSPHWEQAGRIFLQFTRFFANLKNLRCNTYFTARHRFNNLTIMVK